MLGDNAEKSKNPLKKAMRRRNAKQVQFSAPTYHEPPEIEYSDEDEEDADGEDDQPEDTTAVETDPTQAEDTSRTDTTAVVEPLRLKSSQPAGATNGIKLVNGGDADGEVTESMEMDRTSDELTKDDSHLKSRNGVVRNTDSFFKDEETKKISLTPRLLRGDSDSLDTDSTGKPRSSFENLDKLSADEKDKKKKEKKPGVLSGLFKRKDKKGKGQDVDGGDLEKVSEEISRASPQPKESSEVAQDAKITRTEKSPQRQPSKLQKPPPAGMSPKTSPTKDEQFKDSPQVVQEAPRSPTHSSTVTPLTLRPVNQEQRVKTPEPRSPALQQTPVITSRENQQDSSALASSPTEPSIRPIRWTEDDDATPPASQQPAMIAKPAVEELPQDQYKERLSESPVQVSR